MRSTGYALLLASAVLATVQVEALAATCYFVFDRNETVIYRDPQPPVDMSFRGAAARDTLRQRGEFLMFVDTEPCAPLAFLTGPGTPGTLSVDQIVGGYQPMTNAGSASGAMGRRGSSGGAAGPSAPASGSASSGPASYK